MARLARGRVLPHRLSPEDGRTLEVAEELCGLYAGHTNGARSHLEKKLAEAEEELGPRLDPRRGFKIVRALAKLLEERAGWTDPTEADPYTVRTRLFELAAAMPELPVPEPGLLDAASREQVVSQVANETGLQAPDAVMYADRQGAQVLGEFDRPAADELVHRYNVAQVQGVLYSAREMTVDLGDPRRCPAGVPLRQVYGPHLPARDYVRAATGYTSTVRSPFSARPANTVSGWRSSCRDLLLTAPWKLSATVDWKGRDAELQARLRRRPTFRSHYAGPKDLS